LEVVVIAVHVRRFATLAALVAAAAVLVPVGNAKVGDSAPAALPTLYVEYNMNCTFGIFDDNHRRISSIAPGTYQVEVSTPIMFKLVVPGGPDVDHIAPNDFTGCKGWVQFQLTGPGVDLFSTLDSGCDAFLLLPAQNFKANATYTFQDLNQPNVTRTALTVLATGTPTQPTSPYSATTGKGSTFADLVGSAIAKALRGSLTATITANGKPVLLRGGKTISSLKAGRYRFVVVDQSPNRAFTIESKGKTLSLTGNRFVGKRSVTVLLKAGDWTYSAGVGKGRLFTVTR
jgi:hypothetical protein